MSQRPKNVGTDGKKLDFTVLKRLMSYIFSKYKVHYIIVFIGIVISSIAQVSASLFMKVLLDDYIQPLIGQSDKNFTPLLYAIGTMSIVYLIGVLTNFMYQ